MLNIGKRAFLFGKQAAGDPWTPSELGASLLGWYKADSITGLSDGGRISTWSDSSGNSRNYSQTDNTRKPVYKTNIQNSLPIVRCDDTYWLDGPTPFIHPNGNATIAGVVKSGNFTTGYIINDGSTFDYYAMRYGNNTVYIEYNYDSGYVSGSASAPSVDTTKFQIHLVNDTGSAVSASVNGSSLSSPASYSPRGSLPSPVSSRMFLRAATVSNAWRGDVGEIVVCSVLSESDRQKLEGYLAHRWGIASDLASGHPYKNNPPTV